MGQLGNHCGLDMSGAEWSIRTLPVTQKVCQTLPCLQATGLAFAHIDMREHTPIAKQDAKQDQATRAR